MVAQKATNDLTRHWEIPSNRFYSAKPMKVMGIARNIGLAVSASFAITGSQNVLGQSEDPAYVVPIVAVIIDPEPYLDARIRVVGYLKTESLDPSFLFLSRDSADAWDVASSVKIFDEVMESMQYSDCADRYVHVTGRLQRLSNSEIGLTEIEEVRVAGEFTTKVPSVILA